MKTKALNIVLISLVAGFLVCIGILIRQNSQLSSLQAQLAESQLHIYQVEKASDVTQVNRTSITQIRSLPSGVYELTTEVVIDPSETERRVYTIYHFVMNIQVGAYKRRLQFGYASADLLSHIFYFDHNSDGKVDTGMMEKYAESIPAVGKAVAWLFDPELSQSIYNAFRVNSDNAVKLSFGVIANRVDKKVQIIWEWITESSSDFGKWIEESVGVD